MNAACDKSQPTPASVFEWLEPLCACLVLALGAWLSSGTMAPYGASLPNAYVQPCGYLANIDHEHFKAPYLMLKGAPRVQWDFSVYLRRLLHPLLAWPLMKAWGFMVGGFVANVLMNVAGLLFFWRFVRRRLGPAGARAALWLVATYPGITYWIGLPYAHALIVPSCLVLTALCWKLGETSRHLPAFLLSLAMGALYLGYDLVVFFAPAAAYVLLRQKKLRLLPALVAGTVLPTAASWLVLKYGFHAPLLNSNTQSYLDILRSWAHPGDLSAWAALLAKVPEVAYECFLFGNFLVLPVLFLALWALAAIGERRFRLDSPESAIFLAVTAVFVFNNFAPPYPGWQMRGVWIPRIYQPLFVAFVLYAARAVADAKPWRRQVAIALVGLAIVANESVVLGPVLKARHAETLYYRFYKHSPPALLANLHKYGRRPLGFCQQ